MIENYLDLFRYSRLCRSEAFNDYFANVGLKLAENIPIQSNLLSITLSIAR